MPSRESELWDNLANAVLDNNHDAIDELIRDVPFGSVLVNLVAGSLNNRMAFGEIVQGTDPGIGAKSFEPTGGSNDG